MLNVVCFFWKGSDRPSWQSEETGQVYINNLYRGVKRNLTLPHRFWCFYQKGLELELDEGIHAVPFDSPSWKGCFPKLKAFDPENGLSGRVVVMDLDMVVTGSLDEMFSYNGYLMTRSTFVREQKSGGDIVFFRAGMFPFWTTLVDNPESFERKYGGRERFVYRDAWKPYFDFVQDLYPGQLCSYKRHVRRYGIPNNCRLISYHGRPRPHEIKNPLLAQYWNG